jgi:hypothetical protein
MIDYPFAAECNHLCPLQIRQGCGLLPDQYFVLAARRLSASMDLEAEMYRFESSLAAEREKYSLMEPPLSDREKQAAVAIDAVSTCSLGVPLWTCNLL